MDVLPAIDVLQGRCVRLAAGDRDRVTIEGGDPEDAARRFTAEGAAFLHLVDLDGAFSGSPTPGLVDSGSSYLDIADTVRTSTATVTRVAHWLRHGAGGYALALERTSRRSES